ncbi:DUF6789 family protein [Brevundimonas goettingensis]|nr:DUF6789 family protein [Brevundimonas goettingensis]
MSRVKKGLVAGLAATVVVFVLEGINQFAGPWFTPSFPAIVASMIGMDGNVAVGWIAHFLMGTVVLGPLFGILCPRLPTDTQATKGIAFSVGAFVIMMTGVFLFGGPSTFAGDAGFGVVAWLLITNVVFGIVLGLVYGELVTREKKAAKLMSAGGIPAH